MEESFFEHGGNKSSFEKLLDGNSIASAGLSIGMTAEMFRMANTETVIKYTPKGVALVVPGGSRRFLPWINPNGALVKGVKAGGYITGGIGAAFEYYSAVDSLVEGDYASAAESGFDASVAVYGLTTSNPWGAGAAVSYLGGKSIGGFFGNRAVRSLIEKQLPGAEFSVKLGTDTLDGLRSKYQDHCL